jgi:hypothetical protein
MSPLEFTLHVMRTTADERIALDAAKAALPYCHGKVDAALAQPEGKKAQALEDAKHPDRETALGELMALRMTGNAN